ncbi:hypothetical protein GCM10023219_20610 [Stakelama sediminis]|uniref:Outer membrane receptor protein involved in Fe transport n=1 Tax=Stakelama sediminis TaxID=463200 RepID=A0A840Z1Q8_9SPHN|nr:TonB-dependent receptor [Stakelama sediminis]MBB5719928.1 outer membrane receptor protein involved in Fe transport [Stakelama sediminis]
MRIQQAMMLGTSAAVTVLAGISCATAGQQAQRTYAIAAGPLGSSLRQVALLSGTNLIIPAGLVAGKRAPALSGRYTAEQAIAILLAGSGLRARRAGTALIIERVQRSNGAGETAATRDILVTGSRIRGAPVASPVIRLDQQQMRDAGQATLGEVVRSIPQSFGGGQNPGIGLNVPAINGVDVGGGSSINLRGLGSDATLTLLNGHRIAYSGSRQSVDVSTIPLGAVDRIEIVPDGASALYGSDAVGGVANILLKRDMNGVETRARIGGSTDGGNFSQLYAVTGGKRWTGGGFIAAYQYSSNSAISASQRSYAANRSPGLTLYPAMRAHNALISLHQDLSPSLSFRVDALFNTRRSVTGYATNPAGDLTLGRQNQVTQDRAYALAPSFQLALGSGWRLALSGSIAGDRVGYDIVRYAGTTRVPLAAGCYCNHAKGFELSGDGPLFRMPAGMVKVATGIGYRTVSLKNDRGAGSPLNFSRSQWDRYAYGELDVPLVAPVLHVPGIYRLNLSAAARYEDYENTGSVTTPKLGLVYAPIAALDLKASWGRSFRAATLLQRYQPPLIELLDARAFGAVNPPAGATALYVMGGNPDLAPERATNWSVTAALHPPSMTGFRAELSYFNVRYFDRIVNPIGFISQSLQDPIYASSVIRSPSPALLQQLIASGASFYNGTGEAYDPSSVIAVIDNSNVNAGHQWAHGIDVLLSYDGALGTRGDRIALGLDVSYLTSHRQISTDQPDLQLAGILFNPPHWRGRGHVSWKHQGLTLTAVASYSGRLADTRFTPIVSLPAQMRFDFVARYQLGTRGKGWLDGLDLTLALDNAFNVTPPPISVSTVSDTPYDSTNYSPLGRVLSIGIAKKW